MGRFINADALVATGQGILGNNMFVYCSNNPIRYYDSTGTRHEDADEEENGTRIVGAGVQVNIDAGHGTMGLEVILYWDPNVCGEGNWVIAIYSYGGVSMEFSDPWLASIVAITTDNADLLMADAENNVNKVLLFIASTLGDGFSLSVSGLIVFGNEDFTSPKSYEQSFTSVGGGLGKLRASVAYSDTGFAISCGYNCLGGRKILPTVDVSKTYYKLEIQHTVPALLN